MNTCPIPDPSQKRANAIISEAEQVMREKVLAALKEAEEAVAAGFRMNDLEGPRPPYEYFVAGLHQHLYCVMCGADPETMMGGDPGLAIHVIRNSQNIAKHYWGADIEPYPPGEP